MKYTPKIPSKEDVAWRKGYDLGIQTALRQNDEAIKIGLAILAVLDNRYEFSQKDY